MKYITWDVIIVVHAIVIVHKIAFRGVQKNRYDGLLQVYAYWVSIICIMIAVGDQCILSAMIWTLIINANRLNRPFWIIHEFNSLNPEICGYDFKCVNFQQNMASDILNIQANLTLELMSENQVVGKLLAR